MSSQRASAPGKERRLTKRGAGLLLAGTFFACGWAANRVLPTEAPQPPDLVRYEDGSGVLYQGDQEIATYPEGTFPWNCKTMGNHVCGDVDDADIQP